jgi:hypothetical protein
VRRRDGTGAEQIIEEACGHGGLAGAAQPYQGQDAAEAVPPQAVQLRQLGITADEVRRSR